MHRIAAAAGIGVVLTCAGSTLARAQGGAAAPASGDHANAPRLEASAIQSDIRLDGRLDEPSWAAAQPASLGIQRDPDEGKPATEQSDIRVVVGSDALYIGARMFDREPGRIVSRLGRRDDQPASDRLTIRLDTRHDHLTAFVFDIYPAGNKGDAAMGSDEFEDNSWDPVWDVATLIDSLGWVAEIRIPFSQLRYDRNTTDWGIQIVRFIQRKQEEDIFSYIPKEENGGVNRYGHLGGMGRLPASRRIEITPYASARAEYTPGQGGNPFRDGSDYFGAAGADLRLGITSNLTLDATINPDFGQVEVDPAVVNLSPFETPFDEKRPFFVEGSDLFRFGLIRTFNSFGQPETFFSRRIGRSPQGFVSDPNATFVDMPGQTTIAGAAKVTGKTRNGWSLAALDAVTPEEQGQYVTGPGSGVLDQPVEPFTNYFVGRVRRELRQGNTVIGGILTAVNRRLEDSVLTANLRSNAYLAGVDLNHSWGGRNWAFDASFATSRIEGSDNAIDRAQRSSARFFQRPDANNLNYDPTRNSLGGYALQTAVTKLGGGHWGGNLAYQEKSPGYETNDIGFEQITGRRGVSTDLHYFEPRASGILRNYTIGFLTGNDWNYDGDRTTKYVGTIVNSRFRNFWSLNSNFFYNFRVFDDMLTRGGPQAEQPANGNLNVFISSDDRGAWSVGSNGSFNWDDAGGRSSSVGLSVSFQPAPNIRFRFEPNYSQVHSIAQFVRGVTDPTATATFGRRSVFATLDQNELALNTRLEWTFTPKMSLQLFMQPLISAGDFTDYKELARPRTFRFDQYGKDIGTIQQDPTTGDFTVDPDGVAGPATAFSFPEQNFNFRSIRANLVFRWEYRPGSTIFLVWQQERSGAEPIGDFSLRRDLGAIFDYPATNLLAVKVTYWMGL